MRLCAVIIVGIALITISIYSFITGAAFFQGIVHLAVLAITAFFLFCYIRETKEQKKERDKVTIRLLIIAMILALVSITLTLFLR